MDEERTNMRKFRSLIGFPAADRIVSVGDVFREYLPGRGLEEWERRTYFCEATRVVLNKIAVETCPDWFEEIKPKRVLVIEIEDKGTDICEGLPKIIDSVTIQGGCPPDSKFDKQ